MPKRQRPHYIVVPTSLIDDPRIPDDSPLFRRYCKLLIGAWIETGSQYHHVDLSNAELAELWQIAETSARASLAEMKQLGWVTVEQLGRVRRIHLHMAWRGKGKDSVAEPNAPPANALRPQARTTATGSPTPMGDDDSRSDVPRDVAHDGICEGARPPSTRAHLPNAVAVVKRKKGKEKQPASLPPSEGVRPEIGALFAALGIDDLTWKELAVLPHVTAAYLQAWVEHRGENPHLGGGYYVRKIRAGSVPVPDEVCRSSARRQLDTIAMSDSCDVSNAKEIWQHILDQLWLQMDADSFNQWLRPSRAVAYDGERLTVLVPNLQAWEWLTEQVQDDLHQVAANVVGRSIEIHCDIDWMTS